jgi:8-hydroxy-5-deazaflavin:NADPH oxidoreductase
VKIGIIGAGNMGSAFARRLAAAGHELAITAKDTAGAQQVAAQVGHRVRVLPQGEIAEGTDLLILAVPYAQAADALKAVRHTDGKAVVDISNPMTEDMSGLLLGHTTSAAEEIQRAVPGAKIVKAFNTVFAQVLGGQQQRDAERVQVFCAADDPGAKDTVRRLAESAGFEAVDAGPLANARYLEPLGMLNIWFGYVGGRGTRVAPAWREVG